MFILFIPQLIGQGRANPSQVADAMLDSVADFINTTPSPSLQKIRIVIFQPHMLNEFHSSMKKHETSTSPENESVLKKIARKYQTFYKVECILY